MALRMSSQRLVRAALASQARAPVQPAAAVSARGMSLLGNLFGGKGKPAADADADKPKDKSKEEGGKKEAAGGDVAGQAQQKAAEALKSAQASAADALGRAKEAITKPDVASFKRALDEARRDLLESSGAHLYGGWVPKETRDKYRALKKKEYELEVANRAAYEKMMESDPEAGSSVVMHKDSTLSQAWKKFKDTNPVMQNLDTLKSKYESSDNLVAVYLHRFQDSIRGMFAENEHAQVMREIRMIDPNFEVERWLREVQQYIIPEVLDAFMRGDLETLRLWCSDGPYNVLQMTIDQQRQEGHVIDSKVMDLRNVDLAMARMIDGRPVLVVSFMTYQVTLIRDASGLVIEGKENDISRVGYVMALYREADRHPITGGWKVIEIGIESATAAF